MCRPDYFDVTRRSETNRMMDPDNPPDILLAMNQWQILFGNYKKEGINVPLIDPVSGLEDMTFIANAGLLIGDHFILSNFLEKERQPEKEYYHEYFSKRYSNIHSFPHEAIFEGQGDALMISRNILLIGCNIRTNMWAIKYISRLCSRINLKIEVIPLNMRLVSDYLPGENIFYHLDTCLLYLQRVNTFVIYPRAFDKDVIRILNNLGNVVCLDREEAETFACNSVVVSDDLIFTPILKHKRVMSIFQDFGYRIKEHDMSEFMKSGGAERCLSLVL